MISLYRWGSGVKRVILNIVLCGELYGLGLNYLALIPRLATSSWNLA
jgi:hypothetical protein